MIACVTDGCGLRGTSAPLWEKTEDLKKTSAEVSRASVSPFDPRLQDREGDEVRSQSRAFNYAHVRFVSALGRSRVREAFRLIIKLLEAPSLIPVPKRYLQFFCHSRRLDGALRAFNIRMQKGPLLAQKCDLWWEV